MAKVLSTHVSKDFTQVSIPTEDGSQRLPTFTHAIKGSITFMPTHAPNGPALLCPLQVLQAHNKQPNFINNKESIHNPNISTKVTNNQNNPQKQKKNKTNTPQYTFIEAVS
jgi:hypothetical protein